ncbi:MAG: hypothetical protein H0X39_11480 [Actinobacteria bacterium]|nr:hypothetical protein [Actinomycetota bacterium]
MRSAFKYLAGLFFVGIVVQVGLAGIGAFHAVNKNDDGPIAKDKASDWYSAHGIVGSVLVLVALLLLIVALIARDKTWRKQAGVLFVLMILQLVFAGLGSSVWALGFLHPINALAIFALSGMLAHSAWRSTTDPPVSPAAASVV